VFAQQSEMYAKFEVAAIRKGRRDTCAAAVGFAKNLSIIIITIIIKEFCDTL